MNSNQGITGAIQRLVVISAALLAIALGTFAQVQTKQQVASGTANRNVVIERGVVVNVSGNSVIVKADDGTIRHFDNVPETVTVTVDGQQLNVHQLKAGMKVERQTITTTVPRVITTVKTVTGVITQINPPYSVTLSLENGHSQRFDIPKGQVFTIDGQKLDAFGLRKGMKVNAQKVTEEPEIMVSQDVVRSGTMPPPTPAPEVAILIVHVPVRQPAVVATPVPTPAPTTTPVEPTPTKLPKTGSNLPLLGLLGVLTIGLGLGLKVLRIAAERS